MVFNFFKHTFQIFWYTLNMKNLAVFLSIFIFTVTCFSQQKVGVAAQNFNGVSLKGESIELEKLKGNVVVVTFWSTRCRICISEMPKLNALVDKYKGEKVVFLGLTMNNESMINRFLRKKSFKFTILPNSFGVVLKYADRDKRGRMNMGFPAHYVVDQTGNVVLKTSGFKKSKKVGRSASRAT